jgi:hypothetical protein
VGELVDQRHLRCPAQDRVDVHLLKFCAAVDQFASGYHFQVADLLGGAGTSVGLYQPDHYVGAPTRSSTAFVEHGVRLADAGSGAQIDAELATRHEVDPRSWTG